MDDQLNVIDLYQRADSKRINAFERKIKSDMVVDLHYDKLEANFEWLDIMEETIRYLDNILRNPNRFIINEDEVVKVELAKHVTVESIKHLARNTNLIQEIDENDEVKPSKILNINKEESFDTYENRFIYTLIINMETFIQFKKKTILASSYLKDDKSLQYKGASMVGNERISIELNMKSSLHENKGDGGKDGDNLLTRVDKLCQRIIDLKNTQVFKDLARAHVALVRPPLKKTNVILKNTNFQYAVTLWNYLQEHFADEDKNEVINKNYAEDGELKSLFDEAFLMAYLSLLTLNKEEYDTRNMKERVMKQVIEKIVDLNASMTEEELKDLIGEQISIVKYKNNATMEGVENVYKKHIEKYITKISNMSLS